MYILNGNIPRMFQDATVFEPDSILFDLAETVDNSEKDAARLLVKEALCFMDYTKVEVAVRINSLDSGYGLEDLETIARVKPDTILVPKATEEQLVKIDNFLSQIEKEEGFPAGNIKLIPVIQTAYALHYVNRIIKASPRVDGAYFNAEGLAADLGIPRVKDSDQIIYARSRIAITCRAENLGVVDTPYMDGDDTDGLIQDATKARYLGLTGKATFDGRQVDVIHQIFE
jgi:citrate lyase subunit beta/citryl-CoA lyase